MKLDDNESNYILLTLIIAVHDCGLITFCVSSIWPILSCALRILGFPDNFSSSGLIYIL